MTINKHLLAGLTALGMTFAGASAHAITYFEAGDTGDLAGTAQAIGAADDISGGLTAGSDDVDLYSFIWGGGVLSIDTDGSSFDTQLHLFDALGNGIAENDDGSGLGLLSAISLDLAAGTYLLGITDFNNDAVDAGGNPIFGFSNTFDDLAGNFIQGPEGNGPLAGWDGGNFGGSGEYVINFSATTSAPPTGVAEPGTLLMLGAGLLGFAATRRRKV